jgi:DNA-binding MarR family transcriptional regulator
MAAQSSIRTLRVLDRASRFALARLSADTTAQRLLILHAVYFNEGLSPRELPQHLESTSSTALSRNLADLSGLTSRKMPGPNLLERRIDRLNIRIKRVFPTRKGKSLMKRWLDVAGGTVRANP